MKTTRRLFLNFLMFAPVLNLLNALRKLFAPPADVVDVSIPGVGELWTDEWPNGRVPECDYFDPVYSIHFPSETVELREMPRRFHGVLIPRGKA